MGGGGGGAEFWVKMEFQQYLWKVSRVLARIVASEKFNTEKYKYINIFYFYSVVLPPLSFCLGPELAYSNLFTKHTAAFNLN